MNTNLKNLSDNELWSQTKIAAQTEKESTLALLQYLQEVDRRRLYAERSYPDLFEFIVKELKYSESQAYERMSAMRLLRDVEEVKKDLQTGELSLTTASQIQRFLKAEKKNSGKALSKDEKLNLISKCKNQSKRRVERILIEESSNPSPVFKEKARVVSSDMTELKFLVSEEEMKKLRELRDLTEVQLSEIFAAGVQALLQKARSKNELKYKDRTRDKNCSQAYTVNDSRTQNSTLNSTFPEKLSSAEEIAASTNPNEKPNSRYIPKSVRAAVAGRSQNQCEYRDPLTKKRCTSTYRLQFEHRKPFAFGGQSTTENLLHYCHTHNQLAAIKIFGKSKMLAFTRNI